MRSITRGSFILLFLTLRYFHANAQNDYVITLNNDTIRCKIRGDFWGHLKYKAGKDNVDLYTLDAIDKVKEFFIAKDTATFVVKGLPGSTVKTWLQWLERGRINLYEGKVKGSSVYTDEVFWYACKGNDSLAEIKTSAGLRSNSSSTHKDRIKAFFVLIADDPYVVEKARKAKLERNYDIDSIRYYIKIYNNRYLVNN